MVFVTLRLLPKCNVSARFVATTANSHQLLKSWGSRWVPPKQYPELPADYKEFPERDLVNFPRPPKYVFSPKHRLGFIPESWFNFFYNKTGVTGPYLLGGGLLAFMYNKEFIIVNGEHKYVTAFLALNFLICRFAAAKLAPLYDEHLNKDERNFLAGFKNLVDKSKEKVEASKDLVARCEGWSDMLFQAQKDQVYMAMEEEYRKRMLECQAAVKRKLDYIVDLDDAKKRYQRRHIVDWVVDQVQKSINEKTQKAAFSQCLVQLKTLSAKAQI